MSAVVGAPAEGAGQPHAQRTWMVAVAVVVWAAAATTFLPDLGLRTWVVACASVLLGGALALLATAHIRAFVLGALVLRAAVDWTNRGFVGEGLPTTGLAATALALVFLAGAGTWLVVGAATGRARARSPLAWAAAAVVAAGAVSIAISEQPGASATELLRILSAVAMLLVLDQLLEDAADSRGVLLAIFASALAPLVVAATQLAAPVVTGEQLRRVTGTFVHPNAFGAYLAVLVIAAVALWPHVSWRVRPALALLVVALLTALVLTYSRGNWLFAAVGLLVIALFQSRLLVLLLLVGALALPALVPSIATRVENVSAERNPSGTAGNSLVWRTDYWRESLARNTDAPVTGIGVGMAERSSGTRLPPHNDYIRLYVETGWLGLAAYLALLATMLGTGGRALRATRGTRGIGRGVAVGFTAVTVGFAVASAGGNLITRVAVLWYVFALAGAAVAVARGTRAAVASAPAPAP